MATKDIGQGGGWEVSRRDFLKSTAVAAAAAGCGLDFAFDAEKATAYEKDSNGAGLNLYTITSTTCPYCSASRGQRTVVEKSSGKVIDMYGDFESPFNSGGLCSKGAGTFQLVTNPRRIGAWSDAHPVNAVFAAKIGPWDFGADPVPANWPGVAYGGGTYSYDDGVAWFRSGNNAWQRVPLAVAMREAADQLYDARGGTQLTPGANPKGVAFFGSSHMNNESNYVYRKLIANFGTSNTEHQARI
jgi:formate dehydrogenase major subunit